jgi:putative DNA primase/helicase
VRLVVSSETKDGQHLDIGVIKSHTGDGKMNARRMRQDGGEFEITHKPWLLTNELPGIDRVDPAIKGRLHYIPFDRRWNRPGETDRNPALPDGDKELKAHLLGVEREGILAALVRGAVDYYAHGLNPPAEVIDQTKQSFAQQDHLGRWLLTMQQCAAKQGMSASELFTLFGMWVAKDGCEFVPATQAAFGRALSTRGIEKAKGMSNNLWGLRALQVAPSPPKD